MGFLKDLQQTKKAVFVPVDESDLWYSVGSPEEEILDKLVEKNSDGQPGIYFYRFNGLSRLEREAVGEASERIRQIQKEYLDIIGAESRKYQLNEEDINRAVTVTLGSSGKKQVLSRLLELAERLDADNPDQNESAVKALQLIARNLGLDDVNSLDELIEREKQRNLDIVAKLGPNFDRLGQLNEANEEAQQQYNYELIAGILSSKLRMVALESLSDAELKTFKVTPENVKNLSPGLVRTIFTEFLNKENRGKSGWSEDEGTLMFYASAKDDKTLTVEDSKLAKGAKYQVTAIQVEAPAEDEGKESVKKSGKS